MFAKLEIIGTIYVKTGLHIGGSSDIAAIGAVDSPVMKDTITQNPLIPGSSLKGKMRTLLAKQYNDGPKKWDEDDERIIRLFGTSKKNHVRIGRLLFSDMIMENQEELKEQGIEYPTEIKFENMISRLTAVATPRQIERVVRGAKFPLRIIYNMDEEKEMEEDFRTLRDVFTLLKYDYLGGNGSRGYGKIEIKDLDLNVCIGEVNSNIWNRCKEILKEV